MTDWRNELNGIFDEETKRRANQKMSREAMQIKRKNIEENFVKTAVIPAFQEIKLEFEKHNQKVTIESASTYAEIRILPGPDWGMSGGEEFDWQFEYTIQGEEIEKEIRIKSLYRYCRERGNPQSFGGDFSNRHYESIAKDDIIKDIMRGYKNMCECRK